MRRNSVSVNPTVTHYNIMDFDRIKACANEEKLEFTEFTIVAIGRLCEAKNYTLLMDSIKELKARNYKLNCVIVGGGQLEKELLKYKDESDLDNVIFVGAKENPYPFLKAADLYVSSSIYEGLSTTTIEALILGKPCLVTDCAGMREILGDGKYGKIVPIDKIKLAEAIEEFLIGGKEILTEFSGKALLGAKRFNPETAFKSIERELDNDSF